RMAAAVTHTVSAGGTRSDRVARGVGVTGGARRQFAEADRRSLPGPGLRGGRGALSLEGMGGDRRPEARYDRPVLPGGRRPDEKRAGAGARACGYPADHDRTLPGHLPALVQKQLSLITYCRNIAAL